MKLVYVVCRVLDEGQKTDRLVNIEPTVFLDLLSKAAEGGDDSDDDIAALQAELDAGRKPAAPPVKSVPTPAVAPKVSTGEKLLPYATFDPLIGAKTRGELFDAVNALLAPFNARIANAGEA